MPVQPSSESRSQAKLSPRQSFGWQWIGLIACIATLSVMATIDPSGSYPHLGEGPGITIDETFNVQQGVLLVEYLRAYGMWSIDPINIRDFFGGEMHLPDHPPLGRFWLGLFHHLTWSVYPPYDPAGPFVTACARFGSAVAFGLTILLIGISTSCWFGRTAGICAALSMMLMPRLYGHAHIASLETVVNLTYCAAVLSVAHLWPRSASRQDKQSVSWKVAAGTGLLLGLAMLTKIQGFLIGPPMVLWALWNWRQRAILPLIIWGGVGGLVFFIGWPWLWLDPVGHFMKFLGSATDRVSLNCYYLGQVYKDVDVPWHYPWVMFLVTVPIGLHLLGFWGLWQALHVSSQSYVAITNHSGLEREQRVKTSKLESTAGLYIVLATILFPLLLFSGKTAVYDGARLFLMVFSLWAIFIGLGGSWLVQKIRQTWTKPIRVIAILLLIYIISPYKYPHYQFTNLQYYNLLSGIINDDVPSFERCYWGESLTRSFWKSCAEKIPKGEAIALAPTLHQFQCEEMEIQYPIIREMNWKIVPANQSDWTPEQRRPLVIFNRLADIPPEIDTKEGMQLHINQNTIIETQQYDPFNSGVLFLPLK